MLHRALRRYARTAAFVGGAAYSLALLAPASAQETKNDVPVPPGKTEVHMKDGSVIFADRVEKRGDKIVITAPTLGANPIEMDAAGVTCFGAACKTGTDTLRSSDNGGGAAPHFGVHGSNTIGARLMPLLLKAFSDKTYGIEAETDEGKPDEQTVYLGGRDAKDLKAVVDLATHGSATAFVDLVAATATIGMASRRIKDDEAQKLVVAGFSDPTSPGNEHVLALDGIAVIVNPDNPVSALSIDDVAGIFSGEIRDWSQLGGPAGPIKINARDDKSGTWDTFNSLVLSRKSKTLATDAQRFESSESLSDAVAQDVHGIGFIGLAYVGNAKAVAIKGKCGIVSKPTQFLVKAEQYPLTRRLFLYTKGEPSDAVAKDFLHFALSDQAQPVISDAGFVPQTVEDETFDQQGQRLATMLISPGRVPSAASRAFVDEVRSAKLISTSFRFNQNSSDLDNKALQDVKRIIDYLHDQKIDGSRLRLIGFTDADGSFFANVKLSQNRALAVAQALVNAGYPLSQQSVIGLGPTSPVACNDDDTGKSINRRVEIWIRN